MPLFKIPNQPLFPDPNRITEPFCGDDYCHLVAFDDPIYAQWYQTPCGVNETCDEDFTDVSLGSEIMAGACGSYTVNGAWSCAVGPVFTHAVSVANETVQLPTAGLTTGSRYQVTFDVANRTAGAVRVGVGLLTSREVTPWVDENGSYTFYVTMDSSTATNDDVWIIATGDFYNPYQPDDAFIGDIQNISIKEITYGCWSDGSGTWEIDGTGGACKSEDGTGDLTDDVGGTTLTGGTYYEMTFIMSNYVQGEVTPKIGNDVLDPVSGNGTFQVYGTPGVAGNVTFTPSNDFRGCIDSVDIRALKNDYTITIVDNETLGEIEDISSYLSYYGKWVTLCIKPSDINLSESCYRLSLFDTCDLQYGEYTDNGVFLGGSGSVIDGWTPVVNSQWDYSGGKCKILYSGGGLESTNPFCNNTYNELFFEDDYADGVTVSNYRITFDVDSRNATVGVATDITVGVRIGNQDTAITYFGPGAGQTYDVEVPVPYGLTTDAPRKGRIQIFGRFDNGSQGEIIIDNVQVAKLSPYQASFISECFKVVNAPPSKSKLVIGTCEEEQFGFEFTNSGFKLLQRVECRGLSPNWKTSRDSYTFSTGTKDLNYAEIEKLWDFFIEASPPSVHGAMALQINCDTLEIGDTETDTKAYVVEDGDYSPLWDRSGASDLAPSRIQLRIQQEGMIFNRKPI